jgi:hypothetical protein
VAWPLAAFYEPETLPAGTFRFWPAPLGVEFQGVSTTHLGRAIELTGSGPFDITDDRVAVLLRRMFVPNWLIENYDGTVVVPDGGGDPEPSSELDEFVLDQGILI